jgi:FMN-dependent oxidoreductase (nitrilotriacetate monooxygenase family)
MSTTLHSPYHLARSFASLDHLSGGRAGWNVVTSHDDHEAQNWGLDRLPDKKTRYDHADEVLEACSQLWETWDEDAVKVNRESGVFADPNAVHYRSYAGSSVWTRGGLTTPHSPQGRPVLMQAGASPRGLEFAARWAEVVFTIQSEPATMREFYGDLKERVRSVGRDPQHCLVFPSIEVLVGETEREAQEQAELLDSFRPDTGLDMVAIITGTDVSRLPLDTPFDQVPLGPDGPASQGFYDNLLGTSGSGRVRTLGEAANIMATNSQSPRLIGTADIIADQLQEQLESGCCDGFIITFALLPGDLIQFVERVVPELQKRGIYREEYAGSTFRENLQS